MKILITLLMGLSVGAVCAADAVKTTDTLTACGLTIDPTTKLITRMPGTGPSAIQKKQTRDMNYGMFIHFGINTFTGKEWTDGSVPASTYAPKEIDADEWVLAAKNAGMSHVVLITKHHDGFCMWPTKFTDYGVTHSGNTTDVVKAVSDACRRHGVHFAIYYSLWDRNWDRRHEADYKKDRAATNKAYTDYMTNQLKELLTQYGPATELWLDGEWAKKPSEWDFPRVYDTVKRCQPECQMAVNHSIVLPGTQTWVHPEKQKEGQEIMSFPSDFRLWDPNLPGKDDPKVFTHGGQNYYMPYESTVCMNNQWFWHEKDKGLKSVDVLEKLYRRATANDNLLLLNCPPDTSGHMRQDNMKRLIELRQKINPAADGAARPALPVKAALTPYPLLNPPKGITPAPTRGWFVWTTGKGEHLPKQSWTPAERQTYEARVNWFHEARYGVFFDFLSGGTWTPEEWDKWVDAVDVEKVADQVKAVGAGYVILTLGQNQIYACAPNPVIDEIWKTSPGQYTSTRDLPMDLWRALDKRGIPLMLYFATDHQHKMPRPKGMTDKDRYEGWIKVAQWYSDHYGSKCKGWWVDGLDEFIPGYRVNIHHALKHGNPDAIVASGTYELSDFTHGHCMPDWNRQRHVCRPFFGRWDADFNIQWQAFQYIGPTWGAPGVAQKSEELVNYAVDCVKGGGVFTFDLGTFTKGCFHRLPKDCPTGKNPDGSRIGPFLEIQPDQLKVLEAVRDTLKEVKASDGSGK